MLLVRPRVRRIRGAQYQPVFDTRGNVDRGGEIEFVPYGGRVREFLDCRVSDNRCTGLVEVICPDLHIDIVSRAQIIFEVYASVCDLAFVAECERLGQPCS